MIPFLTVSTVSNVLQLISLVIVFIIILVVSYYTTRWIGSTSAGRAKQNNIKVIETYKLAANKYIQIIKAADKYFVIGVSKDNIEYFTELEEDKIEFFEPTVAPVDFKDILAKVTKKENKLNK